MGGFNNLLLSTRKYLIKHSPEILTGLGIASMVTSTVLAVKVTPKAKEKIDEFEKHNDDILSEYINNVGHETTIPFKSNYKEKIKLVWKDYLPSAIMGVSGIIFITSANHIHNKRNALLTAAYTLSESTLMKYKDKIINDFGEEKAKQIDRTIREEVKKEKKDNVHHKLNDIDERKFTIIDSYSGLKMPKGTTLNDIDAVLNAVNKNMNYDMYVSAEEWYDKLGFKHIPKCAENVGWRLENGLIEITQNPGLDEDGVPVLYINFVEVPKENYYKFG